MRAPAPITVPGFVGGDLRLAESEDEVGVLRSRLQRGQEEQAEQRMMDSKIGQVRFSIKMLQSSIHFVYLLLASVCVGKHITHVLGPPFVSCPPPCDCVSLNLKKPAVGRYGSALVLVCT